jgi:flagellar biogenesis protein FliO
MFDGRQWRLRSIASTNQQAGNGQPLIGWLATVCLRFTRSKKRGDAEMEVIDRLSLGGRKSLLLVALEQRRFVVAVSGEQVPAVTELSHTVIGDLSFGHQRIRRTGKRPAGKRAAR